MPSDSVSYRKAFGGQGKEPFNWPGPISVKLYSGRADAELRIAYGYPSGVLSCYSNHEGGTLASIAVQKEFKGGYVSAYSKTPADVKNWLLFGSVSPPNIPFAVKRINGRGLTVSSCAESFLLGHGDEAHYFRAVIYHSNGEIFYSKDFRTSGEQPRVDGVADMRFKLDKAAGLLTVYILARGSIKTESGPKVRGAEKWPAEYGAIPANGPYRYYLEEIVWSLPNYQIQ